MAAVDIAVFDQFGAELAQITALFLNGYPLLWALAVLVLVTGATLNKPGKTNPWPLMLGLIPIIPVMLLALHNALFQLAASAP